MIDFNAKDELSRTRILIYQYIIFKGDKLRLDAVKATDKLRTFKKLSTSDLEEIYKCLLMDELFDIISKDLCNLLDLLP